MRIKLWVRYISTICLYLFLAGMIVVGISEKRNLHTDEVLTYLLANNTYDEEITLAPEMGKTYDPAASPWMNVMTVQQNQRFDYENVWKKQAADVHPPLYYTLVHTVCSLFPGVYSKWFAATVNLVFGLFTLYVTRKLVRALTGQEWIVFLCSVFFCVSSGVLSSMTFLRMYVMTMFWCTLFTWIFVKNRKHTNWKFYLEITTVATMGALTHYYFVVYVFSMCVAWGIYLLWNHRWKDLGLSVGSMIVAGILTIAIFPASISQSIGGGYRGVDTLDNLTDLSVEGIWYRLKNCYKLLNQHLFGNCFPILLAITIVGVIFWSISYRKTTSPDLQDKERENWSGWGLAVVPSVLYFLSISKIAVYITERYFHPIYALLMIFGVALPLSLLRHVKAYRLLVPLFCIVLLGGTLFHWKDNWNYLYRSTGTFLQTTAQYGDQDALCVFEYAFELPTIFCEAQNYKSITFVSTRDLDKLDNLDLAADNGMILILGHGCEAEPVSDAINARWPQLVNSTELGTYASTTTFHLEP